LFPKICEGPLGESMMKRAQEKELATIRIHNLRDWARDKHHITDDAPYGGGQGMVMKPEPIFAAVEQLRIADCGLRKEKDGTAGAVAGEEKGEGGAEHFPQSAIRNPQSKIL